MDPDNLHWSDGQERIINKKRYVMQGNVVGDQSIEEVDEGALEERQEQKAEQLRRDEEARHAPDILIERTGEELKNIERDITETRSHVEESERRLASLKHEEASIQQKVDLITSAQYTWWEKMTGKQEKDQRNLQEYRLHLNGFPSYYESAENLLALEKQKLSALLEEKRRLIERQHDAMVTKEKNG